MPHRRSNCSHGSGSTAASPRDGSASLRAVDFPRSSRLMSIKSRVAAAVVPLCVLAANATASQAQDTAQPPTAPATQLSALAPANLAKPRPKPPFDLTGTWQHDGRANTWRFVPETFKLTPQAQAHYDAGVKALKDGGVYRDDIGQCWPAGVARLMK